jgi:hypothetical protein
VRWVEAGDSLAVGVGSNGLPRRAVRRDARGRSVEARYRAWEFIHGTSWPVRMEFEERAAHITLALKLTHVTRNALPSPERLVVRIPPDAERLEWPAIRRALARTRGL